jgi:hypothetical protein
MINMPRKTKTTKKKPQTPKTRVVYVRERDGLDNTMKTVGNLAVLGIGLGLVGGMLGGMRR